MQETVVKKLEEMGGKRWTKGKYDRIYFSDEMLGIQCRTNEHGSYIEKWADIEDVDMKKVNDVNNSIEENYGYSLSHKECGKYCGHQNYVNIETGNVFCQYFGSVKDFLEARMTYLIKKAEKEIEKTEEKNLPDPELTKDEMIEKMEENLRERYNIFSYNPETVEEKVKRILISKDKKFAMAEVDVTTRKGSKYENTQRWYVSLQLIQRKKEVTILWKYTYSVRLNNDGTFGNLCFGEFHVDDAKKFENGHDWEEYFEASKSQKKIKKFDIKQAIEKIEISKTLEDVKEVLQKSRKDTLKTLAKLSGIEVKSIYSRNTLLSVLIENADKILKCERIKDRIEYMNTSKFEKKYLIKLNETEEDFYWKMNFLTRSILIDISQRKGIKVSTQMKKLDIIQALYEVAA